MESNQEVLDKVEASISNPRIQPIELRLIAKNGDRRDVSFVVRKTDKDASGPLFEGRTDDRRDIIVSVPEQGQVTARLSQVISS